ncbi:hypothetical protein GCM10028787_10680 [Brachybacterium horti]
MNSHDDEPGATFNDGYQAGKNWTSTEQTPPSAINSDDPDDTESAADAIERGRLAGHNYTPNTSNY